MLDRDDLKLLRELLEENRKATVEESNRYMDILYEAKIEPQFRLLAEGHETLLQTLTPKSRVEELADEVGFLKTVVASLSKELNELKKAM